MVRTDRRAVLASVCGVLLPLGGCLEGSGAARSPTTSPSPADDRPSIDASELSIEAVRVRKMIIADWGIWGTLKAGGGQYVVFDLIRPDGTAVMETYDYSYELPLAIELDGDRQETDAYAVAVVEPGADPVDPESIDRHAAAVSVPTGSVDSAAVVWRGEDEEAVGELGPSARRHLSREPRFEIRRFDPVVVDGDIELDLEIANIGDRDGRWLGQVSVQSANDVSDVFGYTVPVGTTISRTVKTDVLRGNAGTVVVQFWSSTEYERTVSVETPTASG